MTTERKWKRRDIGPDGRVFLCYDKSYKSGERWVTSSQFEEFIEKDRERFRKWRAANPGKERERVRKYRAEARNQVAANNFFIFTDAVQQISASLKTE